MDWLWDRIAQPLVDMIGPQAAIGVFCVIVAFVIYQLLSR
jgi:hypothetical protein